jgi:uncharacterized RDD family membrane protein YckC
MDEVCPKCGFHEIVNDECRRCRVIVSKYRLYLESLGTRPSKAVTYPAAPEAPTGFIERGDEWQEGSPAGFWIRAAALFVDGLAFGAVLLPFVLFVVVPTMMAGGLRRPDPALFFAVNLGYQLVAFLVYTGYVAWMHGRWGQTLGKIATGVRVVRVDGGPIGYGRALARVLVTQIVGTPLQLGSMMTMSVPLQLAGSFLSIVILLTNYLMAAWRSDKRALHDIIAGTRVMKVRRAWLEGRPAGFWMRLTAMLLDWEVILFPFAFMAGILLAVAIPAVALRGDRGSPVVGALVFAVSLMFVALLVAYSIWMHGKWGQTLGKMAIGVKVLTTEGAEIGYGTAFLRWIASVVSAIILMIGYLVAGFRRDKRSLHDLIAGTRVTWIR